MASLSSASPFQIGIIILFIVFIVGGIAVFAAFGGLAGSDNVGPVVIWGTLGEQVMQEIIGALASEDGSFDELTYVEKDPVSYRAELVNALAAGRGPDLVFLAQDDIVSFSDKVLPIPYSSVSVRRFNDIYVPEGGLFLAPEGVMGLPFLIDPLVMYVNRDLFTSVGIAQTPRFWDEFFALAPKLTSIDTRSDVRKSAIALGSFDNVRHAKDVLAALFMQAGNAIMVRDETGALRSVLADEQGSIAQPAESALRFYTEFSNPAKSVYSWNRSLPESQSAFVSGNVAVYFGFASELQTLRERNPNLSIEVAPLPQVRDGTTRSTFGRMQAASIMRGAQNPEGAYLVAQKLSEQTIAGGIAFAFNLPPVRRDLLRDTPEDAAQSVFAESALMAKGWLDPNPARSSEVFKAMIESVVSGKFGLRDAISEGTSSLEELARTP